MREATGADRCSLVLVTRAGETELWALEGETSEHRLLPIVPTQLLEHFATHRAAERHADLEASSFESDRHLAAKGFAEVVRAPLRDRTGAPVGILNAVRRASGATVQDERTLQQTAEALEDVLAPQR